MAWFPMALIGALRVTLIGTVLLFLLPRLVMPERPEWTGADRWAAAGAMGLMVLQIVGHVLVPLKLYELLGYSLVLTALVLLLRYLRGGPEAVLAVVKVPLHKILTLIDWFGEAVSHLRKGVTTIRPPKLKWPSWPEVTMLLLGCAITGVAVYGRLTFALRNAAPAPSDYLEHLQWSRWLILPEHRLMDTAVYPKGMNMLHAAFRFLSQEELHVILKVAGPLLNLLTIAAIWYVVRASTRSRVGAIVAAALYAGAPAWIPIEWGRQAVPLPQEFAMALILPAAWWGYRYLDRRDNLDRFLAAGTTLVAAASHWIVLLYMAVAFVIVALCRLDRIRDSVILALWVAGGTVIGLLPQIIALLSGVPLLGTTSQFVVGEARALTIAIRPGIGLIMGGAVAAGLAVARSEPALRLLPGILLAFLGVYALPFVGISSPAIATRSWDFLTLAIAGAVGAGVAGLERLAGPRISPPVAAVASVVLVASIWLSSPPRVLSMEPELTGEYTMQIMRLRREFEPGQWAAVGRPEQVALVLTAGLQFDASRFTQAIPDPPAPGQPIADLVVRSGLVPPDTHRTHVPDFVIFVESPPYISTASRASTQGARVMAEHQTMTAWMERYLQNHPDTMVYYRSPTLTIYLLPAPLQ